MSVDIILDLQAKPESREELISTLIAILPDTRSYKGCQSIVVTSNDADPCNLVLLEKWDSSDDHHSYTAWRRERGDLDKLGALLASPPISRFLTTISS